jgi:hypothetical protein
LVTCTVCAAGLAPPAAAVKLLLELDSAIDGPVLGCETVKVTLTG